MTRDGSYQRVEKKFSIMQYGLGFPAGPECMTHLARALVARGFAANTQDASKAFYSFSRQALLDVISEVWPEATAQFAANYGPASVFVYSHMYKDCEGNSILRVTFSTDGTLAGCVLGSAG